MPAHHSCLSLTAMGGVPIAVCVQFVVLTSTLARMPGSRYVASLRCVPVQVGTMTNVLWLANLVKPGRSKNRHFLDKKYALTSRFTQFCDLRHIGLDQTRPGQTRPDQATRADQTRPLGQNLQS